MTRLPTELRDVLGVDGPPYDLNVVCAAPGCAQRASERHHLWRRSEIGGDHAWVSSALWDGLMGNLVGFCHEHHYQLTVNSAWITFDPETMEFTWHTMLGGERPLEWTPPRAEKHDEYEMEYEIKDSQTLTAAHVHHVTNPHICPSCKRPLPALKIDSGNEPKRPRRTWSITVPVDERENGAAVLDALLDASREEMAKAGLPYGETDSVKFFVLSAALGLFVQHAHMLVTT